MIYEPHIVEKLILLGWKSSLAFPFLSICLLENLDGDLEEYLYLEKFTYQKKEKKKKRRNLLVVCSHTSCRFNNLQI